MSSLRKVIVFAKEGGELKLGNISGMITLFLRAEERGTLMILSTARTLATPSRIYNIYYSLVTLLSSLYLVVSTSHDLRRGTRSVSTSHDLGLGAI